ncbi:MAG TPA: hypothetical protein VIL07_09025 [Symbiobacteriaceae bacterium]
MLAYRESFLATEGAADLQPALDHFATWLRERGLSEDQVDRASLDQYLYDLAVAGANSARLDEAVRALKGYFAWRAARTGIDDPAAGLRLFSEPEQEREQYIRREWAMSDLFYGIVPEKGRAGGA